MIEFIKKNIFVILIFLTTLFVGFLTFLTFIDKSFISLNEKNLNYLLIANIILLLLFFSIIIYEIKNSIKNNINIRGSVANKKYIVFFSLFTLIPSRRQIEYNGGYVNNWSTKEFSDYIKKRSKYIEF